MMPLTAGVPIKAVHITHYVLRYDARTHASLPPVTWAESVTAGFTTIRGFAYHLEMRSALDDARNALGLPGGI